MRYGNAALMAALAACLPVQASAQMRSSSQMIQDEGKADSWTYRNPSAQLNRYTAFIIDPTAVAGSATASWGKIDAVKRQKYADIMTTELRKEIGSAYPIVGRPGPGVARMRVTLLGMEGTKPIAATASRVTPMGLAFTSMKGLVGKKGSFMGSVHVGFELTDSRTGEVQFGAIRRRSANALDFTAAVSNENTVEAVAMDVADAIRKGLDKANGR
jgi:hypothetical protein